VEAGRKFAQGMAQFMPKTAAWIVEMYPADLGREPQPFNAQWAIRAMVRYDRHLFERIDAHDDCHRMLFALSDYNGGSGWRARRQRRSPDPRDYFETHEINPGVAAWAQRENEAYPVRIVFHWAPEYAHWGPNAC
jgi:soluble lytic murein transglycosylase-like protein